jgi:hypothetical protein
MSTSSSLRRTMYPNTMEANDFRVWIQQHVGPSLRIDPKTIKELISNPVSVGEGQGKGDTTAVYNDPALPVTASSNNDQVSQKEVVVSTSSNTNDDLTKSVSANNTSNVGNHHKEDEMKEQTRKVEESQVVTMILSPSNVDDAIEAMNQDNDETPSTAVAISHQYHNNINNAMDNYSHWPLLSLSQRLTNIITRISESFSSYSSWEELVLGKWFANTNTNNSTFFEPSRKRVRMDDE